MENNLNKIKKLEKQLTAAVFLFFILIIGFLAVYDLGSKEALAISTNYNKASGGSLNVGEWNNLDDDFVAKSGDTISGNLMVNGKIGVNTNSPSHELTIKDSTGGPAVYIWGNSQNAELALGDGTSHWGIYSDEEDSDDLKFWRGGINRMMVTDNSAEVLRILDASGNSGGVQGKTYLGFSYFTADINPAARIGVEEDGNYSSNASLVFQTRNSSADVVPTTRMVINKDGNVGIGTINPQGKLDVSGDIAVNDNLFSTCQLCVKWADGNNRANKNFICKPMEEEVQIDFTGNVDNNDDFDIKIIGCSQEVENRFDLCRRYSDGNGRYTKLWECVGFGAELRTDFAGDVDENDDFDFLIKPKASSLAVTSCGLCVRFGDKNNRANYPLRCAHVGTPIKTDFFWDVNYNHGFDLKLSCDINYEDI